MKRTEISQPLVSPQDQYDQNLALISASLAEDNIKYSILGGLAVSGILATPISALRENGTVRDFDALAIGPDEERIAASLEQLADNTKDREIFPELSIDPMAFSDEHLAYTTLQFLSGIRQDQHGRYFVSYRKIEVEVPAETMALVSREVNGVTFTSFPAKTILYRFLIRGGSFKPKDLVKIHQLNDRINQTSSSEPDDYFYQPYQDFARKINEQYALPVQIFKWFWQLDQKLNGKISGGKGWINQQVSHFKK